MTELDDIIKHLDKLGVPSADTLWDRIVKFARNYNYYESASLDDILIIDAEIAAENKFKLSDDQEKAWLKLKEWSANSYPYFVLRGYAGTGKTYLLKMLTELKLTIFFTAPTNKATKVLSKAVNRDAKTTFSQLGIRMAQEDDELKLTFSDNPPYMPKNSILVIDEASMVGKELFDFIHATVKRTGCKVLYVGDPAQLPPVGEMQTKAWKVTEKTANRAFLKKVMRYDNELLSLATLIRENMSNKIYYSPILDANNGNEGVFVYDSKRLFNKKLLSFNKPEDFTTVKLIAWRNKTVNAYNEMIRENFGFKNKYEIGDVVLVAEPVEQYGSIVASIDDEFVIQSITDHIVTVWVYEDDDSSKSNKQHVDVWRITGKDETGFILDFYVPKDKSKVDDILTKSAKMAKRVNGEQRRKRWKNFWEIKAAFQNLRYGYALTAHRAQGSTYHSVFVDQQDILLNENKREAMRCLYVASTRATTSLYSY